MKTPLTAEELLAVVSSWERRSPFSLRWQPRVCRLSSSEGSTPKDISAVLLGLNGLKKTEEDTNEVDGGRGQIWRELACEYVKHVQNSQRTNTYVYNYRYTDNQLIFLNVEMNIECLLQSSFYVSLPYNRKRCRHKNGFIINSLVLKLRHKPSLYVCMCVCTYRVAPRRVLFYASQWCFEVGVQCFQNPVFQM